MADLHCTAEHTVKRKRYTGIGPTDQTSPPLHHAFQVPYCSTNACKFSFFSAQLFRNNLQASVEMKPQLLTNSRECWHNSTFTCSLCTVLPLLHQPGPRPPPPPSITPPFILTLPLPTHARTHARTHTRTHARTHPHMHAHYTSY